MKATPLTITVSQSINPATALMVDSHLFTVPAGWEYEIVEAIEVHTVAGTDGSAVTADLVKSPSGTAPGSGTSLLASTFNLKSTANIPVSKIRGNGLSTSEAVRTLKAGQSLGLNLTGTLTALAGMAITVVLRPTRYGPAR